MDEKIKRAVGRLSRLSGQAGQKGQTGQNGQKVFSLVSGGIDSSVATALALAAGLDVTGVVMLNHPAASDEGASALCRTLGIDLIVFDLKKPFEEMVLKPFEEAYRSGRTPNPCAVCNRSVKLGLLWERIAEYCGNDDFTVLTGHYARTGCGSDDAVLCKGLDPKKDQSYFLCMLPASKVRRLALPLGGFTKNEVREAAKLVNFTKITKTLGAETGFFAALAQKPESMDICFMGEGDYRKFIDCRGKPGNIADINGKVLGRHPGIENFTVGQRKGLGISSTEPLFVIDIYPHDRSIIVAERALAQTDTVSAAGVNILSESRYRDGARLEGKIRSQSPASPCTISLAGPDAVTAHFDEPQFAPAPGQYLVLYDGDVLVAGGEITRRTWPTR